MASATISPRAKSGASRRSPLQALGAWWRRELTWFVPGFLRESEPPARRLLWVEADAAGLSFLRVEKDDIRAVGRLDRSDPAGEKIAFDKFMANMAKVPVGVLVKPGQVLRKTLALPLAARENLDQVVRFEMDRQTPYRVDQIYHRHHETGVDAKTGQVRVDLNALPKHVVVDTLARLREWGVVVHAVAARDEVVTQGDYINFLPEAERPPRRSPWPTLYALMAALSVLLLLALVALPLWRKHEQLHSMAPRVEIAERQARAVDILRKDLQQALGRHNYLIEKKLTTPPRVALIEELARYLPDNTWTESVEVRPDEVIIQGETGSSSRLVGLFDRSRFLGEANYRSPLVKTQNNLEHFELSVALKPISLERTLAEIQAMRQSAHGNAVKAPPARDGGRT